MIKEIIQENAKSRTLRNFENIEASTNRLVNKMNWLWVLLFTFFLISDIVYYFTVENNTFNIIMLCGYIFCFITAHAIGQFLGYGSKYTKYILIAPVYIATTGSGIFSVYSAGIMYFAIIIICSSYFDRKYVLENAILCGFLIIAADMSYVLVDYDSMASHYFGIEYTLTDKLQSQLFWHTLPDLITFAIITFFAVYRADQGSRAVNVWMKEVSEKSRIQGELTIANNIQSGILSEPEFICEDYEVHAMMQSAKEVGGDFYNYTRYNESVVSFCVGDVSGKGIPASMYAVNTLSFLKAYQRTGYGLNQICDITNKSLCEANPNKLFITAILGYLDVFDGTVELINAGHTPVYMIHKNGEVEKLNLKPNFVLGRKAQFRFNSSAFKMEIGDKLFIYTDGITEAMNPDGELFGYERLQKLLEENAKEDGKVLIDKISEAVNAFENKDEQSDDRTVMILDYKATDKSYKYAKKSFAVKRENYQSLLDFVLELPRNHGCSEKMLNNLAICTDEIFANLDSYAFADDDKKRMVDVSTVIWDNIVKLEFANVGAAFNPLAVDNANATLGAKKHKKGGLGIYMMKKLSDEMHYRYDNKNNILTIILKEK